MFGLVLLDRSMREQGEQREARSMSALYGACPGSPVLALTAPHPHDKEGRAQREEGDAQPVVFPEMDSSCLPHFWEGAEGPPAPSKL